MSRESLTRSLEANKAFYARLFAPTIPTHEQILILRKQTFDALEREVMELGVRIRALATDYNHKFDENEPRVPAGNPDGGEWTSDEGMVVNRI